MDHHLRLHRFAGGSGSVEGNCRSRGLVQKLALHLFQLAWLEAKRLAMLKAKALVQLAVPSRLR